MTIYLLAYSSDQLQLEWIPLPLTSANSSCSVTLKNLPGASHIRIILQIVDADDGSAENIVFRGEAPAYHDETVLFIIRLNADYELAVECPGRDVWCLQTQPVGEPLSEQPYAVKQPLKRMDLAIIVDATTRYLPSEPNSSARPLLLANTERWTAHIEKICAFVEALPADCELRVAVLAYGDQEPTLVTNPDLQPSFVLYPEDQAVRKTLLRKTDAVALKKQLLAIPPSLGGDFVDALADALAASQELLWHNDAEKWILITGDSPGFSTFAPLAGDACVRLLDVDTQRLRLQRLGIKMLTVYHSPTDNFVQSLALKAQKELLSAAEQQFRRLASLDDLAFDANTFNAATAAKTITTLPDVMGYGGCCGVLISTQLE